MADENKILKFVPKQGKTAPEVREDCRRILTEVYELLRGKGDDPIPSLVGYLLTEDPAYIAPRSNARALICQLDRDRVLADMVRMYLNV